MANLPVSADPPRHSLLTLASYIGVAFLLMLGWRYADLDLYRAQEGLGYWFGILGAILMLLLLLYPVRKRSKVLQRAGPVRYWFRAHMIFGIVGPLLVIFHSNFELGSLNSRIALFCTIIVASSGLVGRYLYAKLHYGLYGRRASVITLREDISDLRGTGSGIGKLIPTINEELNHWEDAVLSQQYGFVKAFWIALTIEVTSRRKYRRLCDQARQLLDQAADQSTVVSDHRHRVQASATRYLKTRISLMRKFAQYQAFESLFSLWHIVHYPLFILLIVAATVHVVAVHMY